MRSKWKKFWKDKDLIILTSKKINQDEFFETMREISQRMFGVSNPSIFKKFIIPIGEEYEKKRKK